MTEQIDDKQISGQIAEALGESNVALIRKIVGVIGAGRTQAFLAQAQEKIAKGGMVRKDGEQRTAGGVFFYIVRGGISKEEQRRLWPYQKKKHVPKAGGSNTDKPQAQALTWQEAMPLIAQALKSIGEGKTVKITLIGRPSNVVQQSTCVLVSMKGKEPGSLPKGLPTPPANSAITWAIFIVNKQWAKVSESVQNNPEDQLIVEGYPLVDAKRGVGVVLANSCKSVFMDRAEREAKAKV